jgi:hypothetical protein
MNRHSSMNRIYCLSPIYAARICAVEPVAPGAGIGSAADRSVQSITHQPDGRALPPAKSVTARSVRVSEGSMNRCLMETTLRLL